MQSLLEDNRFEIKNETEDQAQSIPISIGTLTVLRCLFGPNLEILTTIAGDVCWDKLTSSTWGKFFTLESNLIMKVKVNHSKNNNDLNQGPLHLWSKCGDPSLNGWWVIARAILVTDVLTDGRADRRRQRQYQNWPRSKINHHIPSHGWYVT